MSHEFDVVVVGTGPAASRIVEACAEHRSVAVVDSRGIGGTCALRGCNPKKVLVRAAELVDAVRRSNGTLVRTGEARIDWAELIAFKNRFTDPVTPRTREKYAELGVAMFDGPARFVGERTLEVEVAEGVGEVLRAEFVVICTGARPRTLSFPGADLLASSAEFLDLASLPEHVVFVGGGFISFEFGHVAHLAGARVTILEREARPLAGFEPQLVDRLVEHSRQRGIDIRTGTEIAAVETTGSENFVVRTRDGATFHAGLVVHGAGRVPNTSGLRLDVAGVDHDEQGIHVDAGLRSVSNPYVFAGGDVVRGDQPKLTPVANEQGRTIARRILEPGDHVPDYGVVPRVLFTVPALACLGHDEESAREAGHDFRIREGDMSEWGSVRKVCGDLAAYRLLVDRTSDRLLGAHLLGPNAAESINLLALAMKFDLTATDVKSVLMAFPTFTSDLRQML